MEHINAWNQADLPGAIILAAGLSMRMSFPKALLPLNQLSSKSADNKPCVPSGIIGNGKIDFSTGLEEITFTEYLCRVFKEWGCPQIYVVMNSDILAPEWDSDLNKIRALAEVVINEKPKHGRFHSFWLAAKLADSRSAYFIHNVDNPFVEKETLDCLYQNRTGNGVIIPKFENKGGHPILVEPDVISSAQYLESRDRHFRKYLSEFPRKYVSVSDSHILTNINTPEEYIAYRSGSTNKENKIIV